MPLFNEKTYDGLWPDEGLISCHIPVRCRSGFSGSLPLEDVVEGAEATKVMKRALHSSGCHILALVGEAGTGKTTALAWLIKTLSGSQKDVSLTAIRCASRTVTELQHIIARDVALASSPRLLIIDGLDELWKAETHGPALPPLDVFLKPAADALSRGLVQIVLSIRTEAGRSLLTPPAAGLSHTTEWGHAWSGVVTRENFRVLILQLQDLAQTDVERYAQARKLKGDFVSHLRTLYDLRELVRRFFLLVKLCDLAERLELEEWVQIRDRTQLYQYLLTAWVKSEKDRVGQEAFPLGHKEAIRLLEDLAVYVPFWATSRQVPLSERLTQVLISPGKTSLPEASLGAIAVALVNANIVEEKGFTHKSIEEYLLAEVIFHHLRNGVDSRIVTSDRITDDVVSFLAESREMRDWLDQNQDSLHEVPTHYLPAIVQLIHRQRRAIPALDLNSANFSGLCLPGIHLRNACLRGANLEKAKLGPADLSGADLRGANLVHASVWAHKNPEAIFPSATGSDNVWIVQPSNDGVGDELVLLRIGFRQGSILKVHLMDSRNEEYQSDGHFVYLVPKKRGIAAFKDVTQIGGEQAKSEQLRLPSDCHPLLCPGKAGSVWWVCPGEVVFERHGIVEQRFSHERGSVRAAIGVPNGSSFLTRGIDGVCIIGSSLWTIGTCFHNNLTRELPMDESPQRLIAIGQLLILFKTKTCWCSTMMGTEDINSHPDIPIINRIVAIPEHGFAIVHSSGVEFRDDNLAPASARFVPISTDSWIEVVGILRSQIRGVAALHGGARWLEIVDEHGSIEKPDWITLRAHGAKFDKHTELSSELHSALISAGARYVSEVAPPSIHSILNSGSKKVMGGSDESLKEATEVTHRMEPTMGKNLQAVRVFYSYSHKDEDLRNQLETHLKLLQRTGLIDSWSDRKIIGGDDWKESIDKNLDEAHIILLLISPDFMASDYCYEKEMNRAMERHEMGKARVIPIIIRDYNWRRAPFAKLQVLPRDGRAVTLWPSLDSAWRDVSEGIERAVEDMQKRLI